MGQVTSSGITGKKARFTIDLPDHSLSFSSKVSRPPYPHIMHVLPGHLSQIIDLLHMYMYDRNVMYLSCMHLGTLCIAFAFALLISVL